MVPLVVGESAKTTGHKRAITIIAGVRICVWFFIFSSFQKEFEKYRKLLGLTGWQIFFEYKPLGDKFAQIKYVLGDGCATATLNSQIPPSLSEHKDVKRDAKHEAIHLLLGRLIWYANQRCVAQETLDEAEEEIVVKLEGLIP